MSLIRYTQPNNLLNEIDRLLEHSFRPWSSNQDMSNVDTSVWSPAIDIREEQNQFVILADLPGLSKDNISISMENNVLTIKGERTEEKKEDKTQYFRMERIRGSFYRRFSLPDTANAEKIEASMNKGVLEITIPKKELAQPRHVEIMEKS